jgi:DNA-binding SARP family transcriptional activator
VSVELRLLGGFALTCDGAAVDMPLSAQQLIAYLALQQAPLLRLHVAGVLWPDTSEKRSYANLRSALCRARCRGHAIVEARGSHVRLDPDVVIDAHTAARLARELLEGEAVRTSADLTRLLSSDLLPDWYDDWLVDERERLRTLRLHALEALAERHIAHGDFGLAAEAGYAALHGDRLHEPANRTLIRTFLAQGNPAAAVRQYSSYHRLLERELGLEPSVQMQDLVSSVPQFSVALARSIKAQRRSSATPGRRLHR